MPYIGTCFRFYSIIYLYANAGRKKKHLHIEFIVTSHNSEAQFSISYRFIASTMKKENQKSKAGIQHSKNIIK